MYHKGVKIEESIASISYSQCRWVVRMDSGKEVDLMEIDFAARPDLVAMSYNNSFFIGKDQDWVEGYREGLRTALVMIGHITILSNVPK